jgi:type IV pilus assembly protein PilF
MTSFTSHLQSSRSCRSTMRQWQRVLCAGAFFALALLSVSGCANNGTSAASGAPSVTSRPDLITDSDEPDVRKRARVRMQLASGYFEQGQTNVALDETKQALLIDPTLPDAYNLRGLIYMRLNDPRLAEDSFRRAIALSQQGRFPEAEQAFGQAMASQVYGDQAKTLMAQGICQARAGRNADAERTLARSYELDAGNPVTGYTLATLMYKRNELPRAQFYIRRLNNSDLANAETLWLGIRVERRLDDRVAMQQLADQLKRRFPQSKELAAYERGAFNE